MDYTHKLLVANSSITDPVFAGKLIFIVNDGDGGTTGVIVNPKEIGKIAYGEMKVGDEMPDPEQIVRDIQKRPQNFTSLYFGGPVQFPGLYFIHGYADFADANFDNMMEEEKSEFDLGIPSSFDLGEDGSPFFEEERKSYSPYSMSGGNEFESEDNDGPRRMNMENMVLMDGLYFGGPAAFCGILKASIEESRSKFRFMTGHAAWAVGQLQDEIDQGAWTLIEDVDPSEVFFDENAINELISTHSKKYPEFESKSNESGWDSVNWRINPSRN